MRAAVLLLAGSILFAASSSAGAGQFYCYATTVKNGDKLSRYLHDQCALYVTPVFQSEDSEYLLAAELNEALPDAGLATCVTEEFEPDIQHAWEDFISNSRANGCTVVLQPAPGGATTQPGG